MVFSTLTLLCGPLCLQNVPSPGRYHPDPSDTHPPPFPLLPQPLAAPTLLSVSMNGTAQGNCVSGIPQYLSFSEVNFTSHDVLEVRPCCTTGDNLLAF